MQATRYLIVGAGMTGAAATQGIRDRDPDGTITFIGADSHPPYKRPPLTKALWSGAAEETIWLPQADRVELRSGRRIVTVDPDAHHATDDTGETYEWEKLLLATGATPRELGDAEGVVYFRTLDDYRRVRQLAQPGSRAIVVGGGFIGSEIAAALVGVGVLVTMLFPESGIGARLFTPELSAFVTDYYREHSVDVLAGETVVDVRDGVLHTDSGRALDADLVVAGLGVLPRTELAEAAGLPVDNGIVVDEYGRVAGYEDVFAAGDAASFPLTALGTRTRVEHEDHANTHGRLVGANMARAGLRYEHLPFFYSDLFDLGYEAVGQVDSRLETVASWEEPNRKGVVAYLDGERRPRGYLLWNAWDHVEAARDRIRAGAPLAEGVGV